MTSSIRPSDAGGTAARQGFKYQDHIAVQCLLKMFIDPVAVRVECETADDIVYVSSPGGAFTYEYIQVKTTEGDKKWSFVEITKLDGKKKDSSLIQKSLLCDINGGIAKFRIVSKRGLYHNLEFLTIEHDQRISDADAIELGAKLAKKFKATKSVSGRDMDYWAKNCTWNIAGETNHIEAQNRTALAQIAEAQGYHPTYTQLKHIYHKLLSIADAAAVASRVREPKKKIITQADLMSWLAQELKATEKENIKTSKPYLSKPEPFLVEFHEFDDNSIKKSFKGYDVQYDFEEWRSKEFAEHLVDWLPEFALKPSELVSLGHHNARQLLARAQAKVSHSRVQRDAIIAELILHAILRTTLSSEPIACKVFYIEDGNFSVFGNAHIVHYPPPNTDELWLGQAKLIPVLQHQLILEEVSTNLALAINKAALSKEREIVVTLREANHLLPITQQLEQALMKNAKTEDLLKVLCFPIMLAYDSTALSKGYSPDYIEDLKLEIENIYKGFHSRLPPSISKIRVVVFLIPIENIKKLTENFDKACGRS